MSASDLSAAVGMRNRLFLLYPKWPGPEPGLLQRSSGAQVRWVPCGARTPANFETSRISCVVALSIMGLLYRPSNVVSKVGSHVGLFFFFFSGPFRFHWGFCFIALVLSLLLGNLWLGVLGSHTVSLDRLRRQ